MHDSTAAAARYDSTAIAVERVQANANRFALSPGGETSAAVKSSQRGLDRAIATLRAHAATTADRSTATGLAADDRGLDAALRRLQNAVSTLSGGSGLIVTKGVLPQVRKMRGTIAHERAAYVRSAGTNMAASGAASSRLSIVALITAALGVAV
ncbi:MAG TPA: hypothetical protein VJN72_12785, partial [Gaiellales bacterium]|nr:hypothetical protein [Gaiellales bacterium]